MATRSAERKECAIVGAGPAGLTAATYLGRFRRGVCVIDAGESRLRRIPLSRNVPGFPQGIAGRELHARMRKQAGLYGAEFRDGQVERIEQMETGGFRLHTSSGAIEAQTVLLATGAQLTEPKVANLDKGLLRGLVRYCPICDGFEAKDRRIAVLGGRRGALAEAHFLRAYSRAVIFLWTADGKPTDEEAKAALEAGIEIRTAPVSAIALKQNVHVTYADGGRDRFDVIYPCLGCDPRSGLGAGLGAEVSAQGGLQADAHQRTSVKGLYAAGDVLQGLDQIASACGQAAIAATAIHNDLRALEPGSSEQPQRR